MRYGSTNNELIRRIGRRKHCAHVVGGRGLWVGGYAVALGEQPLCGVLDWTLIAIRRMHWNEWRQSSDEVIAEHLPTAFGMRTNPPSSNGDANDDAENRQPDEYLQHQVRTPPARIFTIPRRWTRSCLHSR